jgi:hypothetical protein
MTDADGSSSHIEEQELLGFAQQQHKIDKLLLEH